MPATRHARRTRHLQEAGLVVAILLIGLFLTLAGGSVTVGGREVNNFLRLDNVIPSVATTMSWIAIMALGATVVIAAGGIDISVGSIFGLAALATAAALQRFPEDAPAWQVLPTAVAAALGTGLICGLINGAIVVGLRMHPFIVTLGTLSIFRGLALVLVPAKTLPAGDRALPTALTEHFIAWSVQFARGAVGTGGAGDVAGASGAAGATAVVASVPMLLQPVPMLIMLACVVAGWVFLGHTVPGRQVYAVGGNEETARFSGIPVGRVKLMVYALSGAAAGLAGLISAGFYGSASTNTGEGYELMVVAAAVVGGASLTGGRGTALGALLGTLVIKLIDNGTFIVRKIDLGFTTLPMSKEYSKIVIGAAIILAVAVDRLSEYVQSKRGAGRT